MKIEPITFTDKMVRTVTLRAAEPKDAQALIDYLKVVNAETPFLLREPDECDMSLESEKSFLQGKLDAKREIMLIALINGKHVGNCSIASIGSYKRVSHRCGVAIALYQEYCGCGIGRVMLETALDIARKAHYEQAELEVIEGNTNAMALYEKLGFKKYGTFPNNMKYKDGSYRDSYWMMKQFK